MCLDSELANNGHYTLELRSTKQGGGLNYEGIVHGFKKNHYRLNGRGGTQLDIRGCTFYL